MEGTLLMTLVVAKAGLIGACAGYKTVTALLCRRKGLGRSYGALAEDNGPVPWLGAAVSAGLTVLTGYLLALWRMAS